MSRFGTTLECRLNQNKYGTYIAAISYALKSIFTLSNIFVTDKSKVANLSRSRPIH